MLPISYRWSIIPNNLPHVPKFKAVDYIFAVLIYYFYYVRRFFTWIIEYEDNTLVLIQIQKYHIPSENTKKTEPSLIKLTHSAVAKNRGPDALDAPPQVIVCVCVFWMAGVVKWLVVLDLCLNLVNIYIHRSNLIRPQGICCVRSRWSRHS